MKTLLMIVGAVAVATACAGCAWTPPTKIPRVKQGQEIIYTFKQRSVECIVPDKEAAPFCWR